MRLHDYVSDRNRELLHEALSRGVLALAFTGVTLAAVWFAAWLCHMQWSSRLRFDLLDPWPIGVVLVYAAVATWSAWREVDPFVHLPPPTEEERARSAVESLAMKGGGGVALVSLLERRRLAGCGTLLIDGPRSLIKAWRTYRRRVEVEAPLVLEAEGLLQEAIAAPAHVGSRHRSALLLMQLGLAELALDGADEVRLEATTKGIRLRDR